MGHTSNSKLNEPKKKVLEDISWVKDIGLGLVN